MIVLNLCLVRYWISDVTFSLVLGILFGLILDFHRLVCLFNFSFILWISYFYQVLLLFLAERNSTDALHYIKLHHLYFACKFSFMECKQNPKVIVVLYD